MKLSEIFLPLLIGAVMGSFLNVCIYRLPRKESLLRPRSRCPYCGISIKFYHNIPLLSYFFLKGRCAYCGHSLSSRYPAVELTAAVLSLLLYWKFGFSGNTVFYTFLMYMLIVIAFIDWDTNLILNKVLAILATGGAMLNLWLGVIPWLDAFLGMAAGGGLLFLFAVLGNWYYKKESMGMGDVKFAAVLGLFLGWELVLVSLYAGYLFAAIYFILLKLFQKQPTKEIIPMGPFFALGVLVLVVWQQELLHLYLALI